MDVADYLTAAQKNKNYTAWQKTHPHAFLSYFYSDGTCEQIGFYDEQTDKVFSVQFGNDTVLSAWEDDVYRDPAKRVEPLLLETVTQSFLAIKTAATAFFEGKYKTTLLRTLYVLEKIDGTVVWNVTFVMPSLVLLIIRLDPSTAKVLEERQTRLTS
ncbi:hypothetical protein HY639_04095 [Candidatus Woesearchaeota archaeon]|nr:hypothetical protein [Candidatus Woesearchaeota archaeon]